jgi:hypothetical protein
MSETAPKFTLRFHSRRHHALLGLVADSFGVSKNELAEELLGRELEAAALLIERDLDETVRLLSGYRRSESLDDDIAAFAEAEVSARDPLRARMVEDADSDDAFGVAAAFRE